MALISFPTGKGSIDFESAIRPFTGQAPTPVPERVPELVPEVEETPSLTVMALAPTNVTVLASRIDVSPSEVVEDEVERSFTTERVYSTTNPEDYIDVERTTSFKTRDPVSNKTRVINFKD